MYRVLFFWLLFAAPAAATVIDSQLFINEFHYDNTGSDVDQFVEVVIPATFADRSAVSLTLYNGGNGTAYSGPISLDDFTAGDVTQDFAFFSLDISMQNGAPDGLALANGNELLQFLSYEGTFTAQDGVAVGNDSTDVGVSEPTATPVGMSLQLGGEGDSYLDFTWQEPVEHTRGMLNFGQSFLDDGGPGPGPNPGPSTVPEPTSLLTWLVGLAAAMAYGYRRKSHGMKM